MAHAALIPAAVTGGDLGPLDTCIYDGPLMANCEMRLPDVRFLLAGCLDAPEFIVAGNAKAVVIRGELEATTPRTLLRY